MKRKNLIALLLVLLLVLTSACGKSDDTSQSDANTTPAADTKPDAGDSKTSTSNDKAEEKQAAQKREKVTISILQGYEELRPADYNDATERGKKQLDDIRNLVDGYEIEVELEIYDDPVGQLPLLLASNDVPDIVPTHQLVFHEFYASGAFLPLNDLIDKYGHNIKKITHEETWKYVMRGNEICAVPSEGQYYKAQTVIRTDWLEKVGIPYKSHYTLSEFKEILKTFTTQDPDGNGVNDTYGLGTRPNGGDWRWTFMAIFGAFGGQPFHYYERDGKVVYWNATDEFRAAIEYCAELYKNGWVDPECFILNYDQAMLKMVNGKAGVATGWWNIVQSMYSNGFAELNPGGRWDWIYITSDDGTKQGIESHGIVRRTAMIAASCKYPELAMQVMDYLASEENLNPEGYEFDENGHYRYKPGTEPAPENRISKYKTWRDYLGPNGEVPKDEDEAYQYGYRDLPIMYVIQSNYWDERNIKAAELEQPKFEENPRAYYSHIASLKHNNVEGHPAYESLFYGLPATDEALEYSAGLETLMKDWFVAFCTGERKLDDANWAAYLEDLKAKGAQKVLDSYVKLYNEINGTNLVPMQIGN